MALPELPVEAVVGLEQAKLALALLSVDPLLKGVLIRGGPGWGKTMVAGTVRSMLPEGTPFVEVPAAVSVDRLMGGVDWSATLRAGEPRNFAGLLERAHGGLVFAERVNAMPAAAAARIAGALDSGAIEVERNGRARPLRTQFALLATYDAADGEPCALLLDGVGLHVQIDDPESVPARTEIAARALASSDRRSALDARHLGSCAIARGRTGAARDLLPSVTIAYDLQRRLCEIALESGVEGHRAETFAIRAARAHAALCGRRSVNEDDLAVAVPLTIAWRRRGVAAPVRGAAMEPTADGPRSPRAAEGRTGSAGAGRGNSAAREQNETAQPLDHPAPLLAMPRGVSGRAGRGRAESNSDRGRYVRAVQDDPGHGTIAVDATLRAAAPFQSVRRSAGRVKILGQDLRFKQFRRKSGIEIVIALDASGSMAANRIRQAKGAVLRLLRDAYIHRDLVALVGFRGDRAEVLMPPGRSVDLACRALDELPVGGGTPLAAGVLTALGLVRRAVRPVLVVLFTDGRPNVPLSGEPVWAELERVCKAARASRGAWMIIDTSRGGRASADAQTLSAMLNARWVPLSRGEPGPIYDSVARSAAGMRHG